MLDLSFSGVNRLETERMVLSALMLDASSARQWLPKLSEAHFIEPAHATIFRAIATVVAENETSDLVTVHEWLYSAGLRGQSAVGSCNVVIWLHICAKFLPLAGHNPDIHL